MKQTSASRRSGELAREKLASILLFEISDPELELVTLTGCEVSVDRSFVRAYVSCEPERYEAVLAAFGRAKGRIRSLLGRALGWRVTPELAFIIDPSTDEAERIARALEVVPPTLGVQKDEAGYPIESADSGAAATPEAAADQTGERA